MGRGIIKANAYNGAKEILMKAGSMTAAKTHPKHGNKGGFPYDHGLALLREAKKEGIVGTVLEKAAKKLGIDLEEL